MEAEYFDVDSKTSTHQWVHVARGNSSNDDAMITTPDEGQLAGSTQNTPMLSYMVYFNHPGKHYIWIRGSGDSDASGIGNSDSVQIGLNGKLANTAYRIDQFPSQWTWSRHTPSNPVASLNVVNAGVNMVNLWMREDGLAIDKFVITSDPEFVPTGFGPDVTDGTKDYVPPMDNNTDENANPVIDAPVLTDVANDNSSQSDPVNDDTAAEDASSDQPVVADPGNDTSTESPQDRDETVSSVPLTVAADSNDGVFGGSASMAALLTLCFFRVGRSKNKRPV